MEKKIFFICAEKSGNNIIENVLNQLRAEIGREEFKKIHFSGIVFDDTAEKYGIKQLFSPHRLSVLGIGDILTKIPELLDRITDTANAIIREKPDIVISIDAYDFCFRVAKKVQKRIKKSKDKELKKIKMFHIVAPSVWAYWSGRAKKVAKYFNHLFYLLPFEKQYFKPYERYKNLKYDIDEFLTTFVGFPAVFQDRDENIKKDKLAIGITIGSRQGEIRRHKDLIMKTIMRLKMMNNNYKFYILSTKDTSKYIRSLFYKMKNVYVVDDENEKKKIIQQCILVIAKSGTNNIEIGALGTPMITYYKTSTITYLMSKIFAKIKFINLYNITLGRMAIPELHQCRANPESLTNLACNIIANADIRKKQMQDIQTAIKSMQREDKQKPIEAIVKKISCFLKNGNHSYK